MPLKPGATYIYERANGVTYAREAGSLERTAIGWDIDHQMHKELLWKDILREAETNTALQKALENVILLYRLSKDHPL